MCVCVLLWEQVDDDKFGTFARSFFTLFQVHTLNASLSHAKHLLCFLVSRSCVSGWSTCVPRAHRLHHVTKHLRKIRRRHKERYWQILTDLKSTSQATDPDSEANLRLIMISEMNMKLRLA